MKRGLLLLACGWLVSLAAGCCCGGGGMCGGCCNYGAAPCAAYRPAPVPTYTAPPAYVGESSTTTIPPR